MFVFMAGARCMELRSRRRRRRQSGASLAEAAASIGMFLLLGFALYDLSVFVIGVMIQDSATKAVARAVSTATRPVSSPTGGPSVSQVRDGQVSLSEIASNVVPGVISTMEQQYNRNPLYTFRVSSTDYNQSMPNFVIIKTTMTSHIVFPRLPFLKLDDPTTLAQACEPITIAPFAKP